MGIQQYKVRDLLKTINDSGWKTLSAGEGAKGHRYYQWHRIQINSDSPDGWNRWLVLRRNIRNVEQVAYYLAFSSDKKTLEEMAKAAGSRWTMEECFEMAKGEVGLDQYEVRSWTGWYRHITLLLLALSFLVKLRTQLNQSELKIMKKKRLTQQSPMHAFLQLKGLV